MSEFSKQIGAGPAEGSNDNPEVPDIYHQWGRLIISEINKVRSSLSFLGVPTEDAMQVGMLGLLEAQSGYDPEKSKNFVSYASVIVSGRIKDFLRAENPIGRQYSKYNAAISKFNFEFYAENEKEPTVAEISEATGLTPEQINKARILVNRIPIQIVDDLEEERHFELEDHDRLIQPEEVLIINEEMTSLNMAINSLPERDKLLLDLYYKEGKTMKEIAGIMSVSETRISQLHRKVVLSLKRSMNVHNNHNQVSKIESRPNVAQQKKSRQQLELEAVEKFYNDSEIVGADDW